MPLIARVKHKLWGGLVFFLALLCAGIVATIIHECGHCLTANLLGGTCTGIYIWPGIELWPEIGQSQSRLMETHIAYMQYTYGPGWDYKGWQNGLIFFMGSDSNLLLSATALASLWIFKPKGLVRIFLNVEALMFLDIVLYSLLPLVGLQHLFFIGGSDPEPLEAALMLGISKEIFLPGIFVLLGFYSWSLIWGMNPHQKVNTEAQSKE